MVVECGALSVLLCTAFEGYKRVNAGFQSKLLVSHEFQVLGILISTHQSYFSSEYRHILKRAVREQRLDWPKNLLAVSSELESFQLESALKIVLGDYHGAYARTLEEICVVLVQCHKYLCESCPAGQKCSEQVILVSYYASKLGLCQALTLL
jgi:hypothetical protein